MTKTSWFSFFLVAALLLSFFTLSFLRLKKNQTAPADSTVSENYQLSSSSSSFEPLLRGKIDHYDHEQQLLYLQTDEQLLSFPLSLTSAIYCWPTAQNGIQISEAYLPLGPGQVIYIEGESKTTLDQLNLAQLAAKYVFLQQDQNHQLVKAAIINCYE